MSRYTQSAYDIIALITDDISLWNARRELLKVVDVGCTKHELIQTMVSDFHGTLDNGRLNVFINCKFSLSPIKVGMNTCHYCNFLGLILNGSNISE